MTHDEYKKATPFIAQLEEVKSAIDQILNSKLTPEFNLSGNKRFSFSAFEYEEKELNEIRQACLNTLTAKKSRIEKYLKELK